MDIASSSKKMADDEEELYPKTKKGIGRIFELLRCAKCLQVPKPPKDELFSLECDHKYCEECMDTLCGNPCYICNEGCATKEHGPDELTSKILKQMREVEKSLELDIKLVKSKRQRAKMQKNSAEIAAKEGKPVGAIAPGDLKITLSEKVKKVESSPGIVERKVVSSSSIVDPFEFKESDDDLGEKVSVKKRDPQKQAETSNSKGEPAEKDTTTDLNLIDSKKDTVKTESDEKMIARQNLKMKNKVTTAENDVSILSEKNEQAEDDFKTKNVSVRNTSRRSPKRKVAVDEGNNQQKRKTEKTLDSEVSEDADRNTINRSSKRSRKRSAEITENIAIRKTPRPARKIKGTTDEAISEQRKETPKSEVSEVVLNPEKNSKSSISSSKPPSKGSPEITDLGNTPMRTTELQRKRNPPSSSHSSVSSSRSNVQKSSPVTETNNSPSPVNTSFSSSCPVDKRNAKGETQLHVACRSGQLEKIKLLVEKGADLNAQDHAGWTPLHEAITGRSTSKLDLVVYLCKEKCNTNIPGMDDEFALHEAARAGMNDIVECLLSNSASPNVRNKKGQLPRDVAADDAIKLLLDNAAGIDDVGNESLSSSMSDDPVVLQLQFANALLFFAFDLPEKDALAVKSMKLNVSNVLTGEVTHIIFDVPERRDREQGKGRDKARGVSFSPHFLHGMAHGAWMLQREWINKCIAEKKLLSPRDYEVQGCFSVKDAPTRARLNKEVGNCGLLNGFTFYLYKTCSYESFNKQQLSKLIIAAEGKVINREPHPDSVDPLESPIRFHAKEDNHKLVLTSHVILYGDKDVPPQEKKLNMEHIKTLHVKWLIESIGSFSLLNPELYL